MCPYLLSLEVGSFCKMVRSPAQRKKATTCSVHCPATVSAPVVRSSGSKTPLACLLKFSGDGTEHARAPRRRLGAREEEEEEFDCT